MNDGTIKSSMRHLSMLGAWALAFGCAVGSDAFVMPWIDFLPKAGPLGTLLGIFIGGLIMTIVAWNFHYMINRQPEGSHHPLAMYHPRDTDRQRCRCPVRRRSSGYALHTRAAILRQHNSIRSQV